jgi:hypothetical protein
LNRRLVFEEEVPYHYYQQYDDQGCVSN